MKKSLLAIAFVILVGGGVLFHQVSDVKAGGGSAYELSGWAWSSNIGWISFSSANSGAGGGAYFVLIDESGDFSGYAWSPNIGWISFEPSSLSQSPACPSTQGAHVDTSTGAVTGWARAISGVGRTDGWDGCFELSGTNHETGQSYNGSRGVTYHEEYFGPDLIENLVGLLKGYAWGSPVLGWINFSPTANIYVEVCKAENCPGGSGGDLIGGSCVASPTGTLDPGTSVTFTVTPDGGQAPYSYSWNGESPVLNLSQKTISYSSSGSGPVVFITDNRGMTMPVNSPLCPSVVVNEITPSNGLRLLIAPPGASYNDVSSDNLYNDADPKYESLKVIKGQKFELKWNVKQPDMRNAGYDIYEIFPSPGAPSISLSRDDLEMSGSIIVNTSNTVAGKYTYTFKVSDAAESLDIKFSTVKLDIVSSIEEEI